MKIIRKQRHNFKAGFTRLEKTTKEVSDRLAYRVVRSLIARLTYTVRRPGSLTGFSLIEVLIASAIGVVIMTVVVAAYVGGQRNFLTGVAFLDVHSDVRVAMDWIVRDIKWSNEIIPSYGAYTSTSGGNELVLSVPSIDASYDIIDATYDTVVYTVSGSDLLRIVVPDAASARIAETHIVANNVNNLTFTWTTGDTITVSLTIRRTILSTRNIDDTLDTTVKLRNFDSGS